MKKAEILRGGSHFKHTILQGERIEGKLLRCHYLLSDEAGPPLRVGFAVSSRTFNAVRRNRIKRLLRDAVTTEKRVVEHALVAAHRHASAVLLFKGGKSNRVERMKVYMLQPEVAALFRTLALKLQSDQEWQQ